jgi:GAF domain-containing protein
MLEKLDKISENLSALAEEINALRSEVVASSGGAQPGESSAAVSSSSSLALYDQEKGKLIFRTAIGPGAEKLIGIEVPLEGSVNGLAFATGEVQSMTPTHREADKVTGVVYRNVLVAPLLIGEEGVGTINAVNKQNGDHFTAEDMEAYRLFANLAAQLIRQRLHHEMLKRMLKGEQVSVPRGIEAVRSSQSDLTLLKISENIGALSAGREDLLALFQQLTGLMVEISAQYRW